MAKLSEDGKYVIVESGDTLSEISAKYLGSGKPATYKKLAAWNGISDVDTIYVGQKILLYDPGESSYTGPTMNCVSLSDLGIMANDPKTVVATWTWTKVKTTESYKIIWRYCTVNGVWYDSISTTSVDDDYESASRISTFSIPEGAYQIRCKVLPIAEKATESKSGVETAKWTANWCSEKTLVLTTPIATPSTPTLELDELTLTGTLENIEIPDAKGIEFRVVKDDKQVVKTIQAKIVFNVDGAAGRASFACNVAAGAKYKVCCRAYNGAKYSDWSAYTSNVETRPVAPKSISTIRANSETSIYLEWKYEGTGAKTYDVEYATEERYFDGSNQTNTVGNIETTHYEITGLEPGDEYFFRVRAVNDAGVSTWTEPVSVVLGSKPAAPTTWSSTTTAIVAEPLKLYWVHNSEDGSKGTRVDLEIYVDIDMNGPIEPFKFNRTLPLDKDFQDSIIKYTAPKDVDDDAEQAGFIEYNTAGYKEGVIIKWRARTAGITKELGDWSTQRTIDVYAPPTLDFSITDSDAISLEVIDSFPFYARGIAGPNTQAPIGYSVTISSTESYETVDDLGNVKMVSAGDAVYSKYFDITDDLVVEFTPGNIDLENNITYKASCIVSMNSGLTAESNFEFRVAWVEKTYTPNLEISYDPDTYVTYLRPYCEEFTSTNYKVEHNLQTDEYVLTDEVVGRVFVEPGIIGTTVTGETVYLGITSDEIETYFATVEATSLVEDVTLAIYRREFDGTFTKLASGLVNSENTHVTDPHPALDYARYRVVATSKTTGAVSYYDPPGYPIGETAAIIQWDEEWSVFDTQGQDYALSQPPWTGSLLRLPYNIDISNSNTSDVTMVEYIGRKHPVTYYGTQVGETMSWNVTIPKDDLDTIYALRRLAIWMGDVYVRDPSGTGYWANIKVSFNKNHLELTIPVTFDITRAEGGI